MKIILLAGEVSGDRLGAQLANDLRRLIPHVTLIGITGEHMKSAGVRSIATIDSLSVHGLFEVIHKLPKLLYFRVWLRERIIAEQPDLIISIDAPEFNLGLLASLRRKGFKTMHMVCPTIWAWRAGRIKLLKRAVSAVLTLYPFESQVLAQNHIPAFCLGHPLAQNIPLEDGTTTMREQMRINDDEMIITLLPGSRVSEIHQHAFPLIEAARLINLRWSNEGRNKKIKFILPLPTRRTYYEFEMSQYLWKKKHPDLQPPEINLMRGHAERAIAMSDFCLCGSGTVTLEVALYHKPMVVFYRMNALSLFFMRRMYQLPWFSLPNILSGQFLVPELLQEQVTGEAIAEQFFKIWDNVDNKNILRQAYIEMHESLRQPRLEQLQASLTAIGIHTDPNFNH